MGSWLSTEVRQLQSDPFRWIEESFQTGARRKNMESVLARVSVNDDIAYSVKGSLRRKLREKVPNYTFRTFYPRVIISYSTGHRQEYEDDDCAGPGLLVVVGVINLLLDEGYPCYSDILTRAGRNWTEYMLRVKKANVMIVLMTRTFFRSVHCLREVAAAVQHGVVLIPVRCEKLSVNGIDISRDGNEMWPWEELAKYAKNKRNKAAELDDLDRQRHFAADKLATISSIPDNGTFLSQEMSVDELLHNIHEELARATNQMNVRPIVDISEDEKSEPEDGIGIVGILIRRMGELVNTTDHMSSGRTSDTREEEKSSESRQSVGIVGINITTTNLSKWNRFLDENQHTLKNHLETLLTYGELKEGKPEITVEKSPDRHGVEQMVLRIHCAVRITGELEQDERKRVGEICVQIAKLFKTKAGVNDEELEDYMIGGAWKGCLMILLNVPSGVVDKLFEFFLQQEKEIPLEIHGARIVGMSPALLVKGPACARLHESVRRLNQEYLSVDAVTWQTDDMTLLIPTSYDSLQKIVTGGVKFWPENVAGDWKGLPSIRRSMDVPSVFESIEHILRKTVSSRTPPGDYNFISVVGFDSFIYQSRDHQESEFGSKVPMTSATSSSVPINPGTSSRIQSDDYNFISVVVSNSFMYQSRDFSNREFQYR